MFKDIRKLTVEKLKALNVPVFDSKVTPTFIPSLPAICVYTANFAGQGQGVRPTFNWNVELQVDVVNSANESVCVDQTEDLVKGVIDTLMGDDEWLKLFGVLNQPGEIEQVSCNYDYISDGQKLVCTAEIKITASKYGAY